MFLTHYLFNFMDNIHQYCLRYNSWMIFDYILVSINTYSYCNIDQCHIIYYYLNPHYYYYYLYYLYFDYLISNFLNCMVF